MTHAPRLANLPTWLLSQATARSHRILHDHLARAEVSGYEYRVLASLGDLGPLSQAELGRSAGLDRRDVTHTVRQLEARKLLHREADPRDARRVAVALTAAGGRLLERLDAVLDGVQQDVLAPLTTAERDRLVALLRRLS